MIPIQAFRKANEKQLFSNPEDRNVIKKSKFMLRQLVQKADSKKISQKVIIRNGPINIIQYLR